MHTPSVLSGPVARNSSGSINFDEAKMWDEASSVREDGTAIYEAAVLAAVIDGKLVDEELAVLERIAESVGATHSTRLVKERLNVWNHR